MVHFRYVKKSTSWKKNRMIQLSPSQPSLFRIVGRILLLAVFTVEHGPCSSMICRHPTWSFYRYGSYVSLPKGVSKNWEEQSNDNSNHWWCNHNLKDVQSKCFVNPSFLAGFLTGWNMLEHLHEIQSESRHSQSLLMFRRKLKKRSLKWLNMIHD